MSFHKISFFLPNGNRIIKRKALIIAMLEEECGSGIGNDCSRYQYDVETYRQYGIYLKRPTRLNKDFDFTVNISGMWFKKSRRYTSPSHQDIFDILSECKLNFPEQYQKVADSVSSIYRCEDEHLIIPIGVTFHDFQDNEHPVEIILLAIKWLFIVQDCAYWNYSGRAKLYAALKEQKLI